MVEVGGGGGLVGGREGAYLLLKGGHARYKQHGCKLDSALHIEVGMRNRLQKLLEGLLKESIVLVFRHLH